MQSKNIARNNGLEGKELDYATWPRVVIVGGGFGGINAALALRDQPVRVTLVDRNNHHLFQPLLYQVATAELSPTDISAPLRHVFRHRQNIEVLMAEVTGIDSEHQQVHIGDENLPYDYLILATGAGSNYFGHDEWRTMAPGMKSVVDAQAIRSRMLLAFEQAELMAKTESTERMDMLTFVLVGAGPTGVELAGALAEMARKTLTAEFRHIDPAMTRILLIEGEPRILASFPKSLSRKAHKKLERIGVEIKTGVHVTMIDEQGVMVAGEHIQAGTIIWTAGVMASPAGEWLGVEVDTKGRVKILEDLTLPDHKNIFVIGDTAYLQQSGAPLPGVAQVAIQQGKYAAESILARVVHKKELQQPFHYKDKGSLATVGRSYAIADLGFIRISGTIGWLLWAVVHILFLIGFRNRYLTVFQWAWNYLTFDRGARLVSYEDEQAEAEMKSLEVLSIKHADVKEFPRI